MIHVSGKKNTDIYIFPSPTNVNKSQDGGKVPSFELQGTIKIGFLNH